MVTEEIIRYCRGCLLSPTACMMPRQLLYSVRPRLPAKYTRTYSTARSITSSGVPIRRRIKGVSVVPTTVRKRPEARSKARSVCMARCIFSGSRAPK